MNFRRNILALALVALFAVIPVHASLTTFQTFTGNVAYSSDGFGSLSNSGTISASVPVGSTVIAAYLYSATQNNASFSGVGGTLGGTAVSYTTHVFNAAVCCALGMSRADVTSIVKPVIDGGVGGVYNFNITETSSSQDGEALVVVYSDPSLSADHTVAILDGFSAAGGDSFTATFSTPLDPTAPGFGAEMALGIGFSCCNQESTIKVNGTVITNSAGNNDDGLDVANGSLITMGGFNDPFSPMLPAYGDDHERYNLVPQINKGDLSIKVDTNNPSNDDNIFVAVFASTGIASVTTGVPEPSTLLMLGSGVLLALGFARFRKSSV
ncbi:MAG: PEP-CTERM sorting domain-containing protein [Acidobacteriia bacterium]|nr:PEP-CTERM sorting domain-containing protein [Terriglobia bacterium]